MNPTKVTLSSKELELVMNTDLILTKNAVIQKVCDLFGLMSEVYESLLKNHPLIRNEALGSQSPKISKGEKYEGLPWVMLDYPRHFTKIDSLGIRSFFWWGNFCSITLQLSGSFQLQYVNSIQHFFMHKNEDSASHNEWFICIGEDPWNHDFEKNNFELISEKSLKALPDLPFIKLAKKIPLQEWNQLDILFEQHFLEILKMLTSK